MMLQRDAMKRPFEASENTLKVLCSFLKVRAIHRKLFKRGEKKGIA